MVWLEPTDASKTATKQGGHGVWTEGAFAIDEGLWMADWDAEFVDRRNYEDQLYSGWAVEEIRKEAETALRWDGTFPAPRAYGPRYSYSNRCKEVDRKMDEITRQKMSDYLELFDAIKTRISSEQIAVAVLQEIAKDVRRDRRAEEHDTGKSEPATEKQKQFMKKLGIKFPAGVTKQEASLMIDEKREQNGE